MYMYIHTCLYVYTYMWIRIYVWLIQVSNSFLCFGLAAEDDIWAEMPPLRRSLPAAMLCYITL